MVRGWSVLKPVKESLKLAKFLLPIGVGSVLKQWVEESRVGNGSDAFLLWRILLRGESPTAVCCYAKCKSALSGPGSGL